MNSAPGNSAALNLVLLRKLLTVLREFHWPILVPPAVFFAFAAAVVMLLGNAVISHHNTVSLVRAERWVAHTLEVIEQLRSAGNQVLSAESSHRGYILTGKSAYLKPYNANRMGARQVIANLLDIVRDNPEESRYVGELNVLIDQRFDEMDRVLAQYRDGDQDAAVAAINLDVGETLMTRIRDTTSSMIAREETLLRQRHDSAQNTVEAASLSLITSTTFVLGMLVAFYVLLHRYIGRRRQVEEELAASRLVLEQRVVERTADLSELARHLLTVREDEKKAMARELHDELGSNLAAINMDVNWARDKVADIAPVVARRLDRAVGLIGNTVEIKRRIMSGLRPVTLDTLGLEVALDHYVREFSEQMNIEALFDASGDFSDVDGSVTISVYRIVQEALTNVARHAQAKSVSVHLERAGDEVLVEVADNGIGLPDVALSKPKSHGLRGMRERALAGGGMVQATVNELGGTTVLARMPAHARGDAIT